MSITLSQAFRHSYSSEFGRPINAQNPDSFVINYSVLLDNSKISYFDVEFRSSTNDFIIFGMRPLSEKFTPNCIIVKTKAEVIKKLEEVLALMVAS
jgi:hypothetical protein